MLTARQLDALVFIDRYIDESGGMSPTFDEISKALGLASKSGVHRLVCALEHRGFIRRIPDRARSLEVLRLPVRDPEMTP